MFGGSKPSTRLDLVEPPGAFDRARRRAHFIFSPPTESPRAFVALSTRVRERARVILSTASSARTRTRTDLCDAAPSKPSISPLSPNAFADRTAALSKNRHHDGKKTHDGERTQKKRKTKSALSLDAFSRAKKSTYDKRVVLQKKRDLAAAKVNKYRKIEKRLGDSVKVNDAFDPEKYAARLEKFEKDLPKDDGFGRGKRGRQISTTEFSHDPSASDDDDAFRDNVVFPARRDADADEDEDEEPSEDEKETKALPEEDAQDTIVSDTSNKPKIPNKGWNKAVKEGLKKNARREERERELAALREKWAEENAAKKAFFERRDATRDKFRKKNKRGQPVMRHRVDKILEQLQKDA